MPTKDRVVFLLTYSAPHKKSKPFVCAGGSMVARLKPEGTDGRAAAPGVEPPISGVVNGAKVRGHSYFRLATVKSRYSPRHQLQYSTMQ